MSATARRIGEAAIGAFRDLPGFGDFCEWWDELPEAARAEAAEASGKAAVREQKRIAEEVVEAARAADRRVPRHPDPEEGV
jgi:hypothetical protein